MATPHWAIPTMAGTDAANTIDDTYDAGVLALDNVTKYASDVFANRGSAATRKAGFIFQPTDVPGALYFSDGTNWLEVSPGAGSVPIGGVVDYLGSSDPADTRFVKLDGRSLSTTTYAALYALIGNGYDTMNGASAPGAGLFRIPNTGGRTVLGAGAASGLTTRAVGAVGGEETHQLTTTEMPSHNHGGATGTGVTGTGTTGTDSPDHTHGQGNFGSDVFLLWDGVAAFQPPAGNTAALPNLSNPFTAGASARHAHSVPNLSVPSLTIGSQGSDGAHNNMQPFVVFSKIIRIV